MPITDRKEQLLAIINHTHHDHTFIISRAVFFVTGPKETQFVTAFLPFSLEIAKTIQHLIYCNEKSGISTPLLYYCVRQRIIITLLAPYIYRT